MGITTKATVFGAAMLLSFGTVGCATKKHVRQVVAPIEGRVGDVEKKTASNSSSIGELENSVSRVDERAMDAERKASAAGQAAQQAAQEAQRAGQAASEANRAAGDARSLAERGISQLESTVANLENYQLITNESILFGFNKATLTKEGKEKLDQLASQTNNMKHFVIEVQGFTDKSGSANYNLQLSQRRADAVVRYMTVNHNIPLRRIHMVGVGEEKLADEGRGRNANKANRRVEVKVFAVQGLGGQGAQTSAMSGGSTGEASRQMPTETERQSQSQGAQTQTPTTQP